MEIIMPWKIERGGGTCAKTQYAVIKETDGSTVACHSTKSKAEAHLKALYANVKEKMVGYWEGFLTS